jgi:hypothetical protein
VLIVTVVAQGRGGANVKGLVDEAKRDIERSMESGRQALRDASAEAVREMNQSMASERQALRAALGKSVDDAARLLEGKLAESMDTAIQAGTNPLATTAALDAYNDNWTRQFQAQSATIGTLSKDVQDFRTDHHAMRTALEKLANDLKQEWTAFQHAHSSQESAPPAAAGAPDAQGILGALMGRVAALETAETQRLQLEVSSDGVTLAQRVTSQELLTTATVNQCTRFSEKLNELELVVQNIPKLVTEACAAELKTIHDGLNSLDQAKDAGVHDRASITQRVDSLERVDINSLVDTACVQGLQAVSARVKSLEEDSRALSVRMNASGNAPASAAGTALPDDVAQKIAELEQKIDNPAPLTEEQLAKLAELVTLQRTDEVNRKLDALTTQIEDLLETMGTQAQIVKTLQQKPGVTDFVSVFTQPPALDSAIYAPAPP